jgi:hypothetical protein
MATDESLKRSREDAERTERDTLRVWDRSDPTKNEGEIRKLMDQRGLSRADAIEYLRGVRDGRNASARGDSTTYRTDDGAKIE